jgi:hypothetical protein
VDVYFDTNAVNYFDEHPDWPYERLVAARHRLLQRVQARDVSVFVSYPLLEEVLGLLEFNSEKYFRVMSYLLDVSRFNLLLSTDELGRAEVTHGSLRGGNDRLEWFGKAVMVRRALRTGRGLEEIPRLTQAAFAEFEADENQRRDDVRARLPEVTAERPIDETRRWWRNAEAQIDDWVSDHMTSNRERLGLPEDRRNWPAPSALQSIWRYYTYRMARIYLNVGENRRVPGTDSYDAHHYAAASSMDIMVSDDGDLRATCAAIPDQPFRLLTFEELVVHELGIART